MSHSVFRNYSVPGGSNLTNTISGIRNIEDFKLFFINITGHVGETGLIKII